MYKDGKPACPAFFESKCGLNSAERLNLVTVVSCHIDGMRL